MSKNTNIADLINYISVDGSGNVVLSTGQLVATQNYVTTAVSNLVASAPSTLDTLNELATALGNDANFATTVATSIGTKLNLSGGTLTGALSGTSATFSGAVQVGTTSGYLNVGSNVNSGFATYIKAGASGILLSAGTTSSDNTLLIQNAAETTTLFNIKGNGAATLSNNLGIGVTLSAWDASFKALQISGGFAAMGNASAGYVFGNAYFDGDNKYFSTGPSARIDIGNGIIFRVAPSGSTGTTIPYIGALTLASTGAATFSSSVAQLVTIASTATNGSYLGFTNSGTLNGAIGTGANLIGSITNSDLGIWSTGAIAFQANGSERMRITSGGNVGIGTSSPVNYTNYRSLHISGASSTSSAILYLTNSTESIRGLFYAEGSSSIVTIGSQSNHPFSFVTNDTERMRITSGGHVGIKVVPNSGWGSAMSALQIGTGGVLSNWTGSINNFSVGVNAYDNGAGSQLRLYDGAVSNVGFNGDVITFSNAGSNSAGTSISFTEQMRISAPGDLYLYNGSIQQQGVWTVFNTGYTDGTSSFNFDIGVGNEGGGGNIFKVEAGFAHFSGMAYNCLAEFYISTRGTGSEITDIIRRDTSLAGSFTAWKTTSTVLRVNKSAGTYPGGGRYWIKVTKVNY